jgi:hypothetical protein
MEWRNLTAFLFLFFWPALLPAQNSAASILSHPLGDIEAIVMLPTLVPVDLPRATEAQASFDSMIAAHLTAAGLNITPSSEYAAIQTRLRREQGGWFDPQTGKLIQERHDAITLAALNELGERFNADAVLMAKVVPARANFDMGRKAQWAGVTESVTGKTGALAALNNFLATESGFVPALSLVVTITSARGANLYEGTGGIQLLSLLIGQRFVDVDPDFLLSDPIRNERAVALALKDLLPPSPSQSAGTRTSKRKDHDEPRPPPIKTIRPVVAQQPAQPPALRIPRETVHQQIKVIALSPVRAAEHPLSAKVEAQYEQALTRALQKGGFTVVESQKYQELLDPFLQKANGFYDPVTGEIDDAKRRDIVTRANMEIKEKYDCDAVLSAEFVHISAPYGDDSIAKWDGVSQRVYAAEHSPMRDNPISGAEPAVSFQVRLTDLQDNLVFEKRGGIQLLREKLSNGSYRPVSDRLLLLDQALMTRAVDIALSDLTMDW